MKGVLSQRSERERMGRRSRRSDLKISSNREQREATGGAEQSSSPASAAKEPQKG